VSRRLAVFGVALLLAGCDVQPPYAARLTNQQIIEQTKECENAGLRAVAVKNVYGAIYAVQCEPKP
jgi:hypothetical protein